MACTRRVWLDKETQIIYQEAAGVMQDDDYRLLFSETEKCRLLLDDPDNIRILSFGGLKNGKLSSAIRRQVAEVLTKEELEKLAIVGLSIAGRVMLKFMQIGTGTKKVRFFSTEEDARAWLCE